MKRKGFLLAVFISLVFILGCVGGQENFNTGQELSKKGRWGDAIGFYEKALKENPNNKEYLQALTKAKKELALVYYKKVKGFLEDNPDPSFQELNRIVKEVDRAHNLDPKNKPIDTMFNDLVKRKDDLLANIKSLYTQADSHMANKEWTNAIGKLRRVKKLFPGYEETEDKLAKAEEKAAQIFYKQGIEFSKEEDWRMAVNAFKAVVDIDPNYYDIQQLYETAQANNSIDYFINKGEEAIGLRNWDRAFFLYGKALEYEPDNEQLVKRVDELLRNCSHL